MVPSAKKNLLLGIWTIPEFMKDFLIPVILAIISIINILIGQFLPLEKAFDYIDLRQKFLDTYYIDSKTIDSTTKKEIIKREFIGGFQIYNQGTKTAEEVRGIIQSLPGSLQRGPTYESTEECSIDSDGPQNDRFIATCKRLSANASLRVFFSFDRRPNFSQTNIAVTSKQASGKPHNAPRPGRLWRLISWVIFVCIGVLLCTVVYVAVCVWAANKGARFG